MVGQKKINLIFSGLHRIKMCFILKIIWNFSSLKFNKYLKNRSAFDQSPEHGISFITSCIKLLIIKSLKTFCTHATMKKNEIKMNK